MSDYISRQAMIDRIKGTGYADQIKENFLFIARMLPSAPVREVVMCGECVNWDTSWQNDYEPNCHYCPMIDNKCNGDFYCGHAERKANVHP